MLTVAVDTFEVLPHGDDAGMAIKSSVVILDDRRTRIVLLTSHFMTHLRVSYLMRVRVSQAIGVPLDHVLLFSSHNHCCPSVGPLIISSSPEPGPEYLRELDNSLTQVGREVMDGYITLAQRLINQGVPVDVRYGVGHERRITHNRKGRRTDGSSYFMREQDRLKLGDDFTGDIDDNAFVIGFFESDHKPVCFLTQFTGHPVTAHDCDQPMVHGEFPQVACDVLSQAFDGAPVVFLQGCAGDTNSKGLLSTKPVHEKIKDALRHGRLLGETFVKTAQQLTPAKRADLQLMWRPVTLPFKPLPTRQALQQSLERVEAFLDHCDIGDEVATRGCEGLNFSDNMSLPLRKVLVEPVGRWLRWAMAFYDEVRLHEAPKALQLDIAAMRIGDVGIVGMPAEPFLQIGRLIKCKSPLPLTIPCGYMNDAWVGYIPDSENCDDLDYISGYHRYSTELLAYRAPAGDELAHVALQMLSRISKTESS